MVLGYNALLWRPATLCEFLALLADQTFLSAVVHQVGATRLAHLLAMVCPAHALPAVAQQGKSRTKISSTPLTDEARPH